MKIILVDDAMFNRQLLKLYITKLGYEVCGEAENGIKAVEKYKSTEPDVVIMDINMPDRNGLEALEDIRKIDPNAQIIICTAHGKQHLVQESFILGAKDYIIKPVDKHRLEKALNDIESKMTNNFNE